MQFDPCQQPDGPQCTEMDHEFGEAVPALAELRPPLEHEGKPLHWVRQNSQNPAILHYQSSSRLWTGVGCQISLSGDMLHCIGYRYLGPAEFMPTGLLDAWREQKIRITELEKRFDAVLDQYSAATIAAMRHAGRILELEAEIARLKGASAPNEPKSPQDVVWDNALRHSR